ncbi:hypothetical protein AB0A95_31245 [Micromonospora sp. NPDC049230]|uniref:hypothetical protein n=1 Tax=Micromonospora sp. NPDC049230 TaxID=3155502 RepID=UPI0033FEDC5C
MRQMAHGPGCSPPRLVEAPVAVAEYLLATGVRVPVGAFHFIWPWRVRPPL